MYQSTYTISLDKDYETAFNAILKSGEKIGKVKSSDKSNGIIVFKSAMSLTKKSVKYHIKIAKISEEKLTVEIMIITALTEKAIRKIYDEFREILGSILNIPLDELINKEFVPTKIFKGYLEIDENNRKLAITDKFGRARYYKYEDILSFDLLEDGETITSGGLGRAAVGGLTFGAVGAIVGGITGGKKSKSVCTSLAIKISINDIQNPTAYINFINKPIKKSSMIYKTYDKLAQECISILEVICKDVQNKMPSEPFVNQVQPLSEADEILKFKNLLDLGIITQEEFEAKKRQLFGI